MFLFHDFLDVSRYSKKILDNFSDLCSHPEIFSFRTPRHRRTSPARLPASHWPQWRCHGKKASDLQQTWRPMWKYVKRELNELIMNLLWTYYELIMNLLWTYYELIMNLLWTYYELIISNYELIMNLLWTYYELIMNLLWTYYELIMNLLYLIMNLLWTYYI